MDSSRWTRSLKSSYLDDSKSFLKHEVPQSPESLKRSKLNKWRGSMASHHFHLHHHQKHYHLCAGGVLSLVASEPGHGQLSLIRHPHRLGKQQMWRSSKIIKIKRPDHIPMQFRFQLKYLPHCWHLAACPNCTCCDYPEKEKFLAQQKTQHLKLRPPCSIPRYIWCTPRCAAVAEAWPKN